MTTYQTAAGLAELGHRVRVVTSALGVPENLPRDRWLQGDDGFDTWYAPVSVLSEPAPHFTPAARRGFDAAFSDGTDILLLNVGFAHMNVQASMMARKAGIPYVLTPRGVYDPFRLRQRRLAKLAFKLLFEQRVVRHAATIHALNTSEAEAVTACFGAGLPIEIIPNGVQLPDLREKPPRGEGAPRRLIFISRIHSVKGLDLLIPAFARARDSGCGNWELIVAGPDDGYLKTAQNMADGLGLEDSVHFPGAVFDDEKRKLLESADAFALPSYGEGHPVSVLEACAYRLPVLVTRGCNIPEIAETEGGVLCHAEQDDISEALLKLLSASDETRAAWGANARRLVEERFTWDRVVRSLESVYRRLVT
ncbi:MAG: glycosyltransferase [Lentisphaeria bacterium]|nr:glycosyltransferase [Lentisphaeria bacterium]